MVLFVDVPEIVRMLKGKHVADGLGVLGERKHAPDCDCHQSCDNVYALQLHEIEMLLSVTQRANTEFRSNTSIAKYEREARRVRAESAEDGVLCMRDLLRAAGMSQQLTVYVKAIYGEVGFNSRMGKFIREAMRHVDVNWDTPESKPWEFPRKKPRRSVADDEKC